MTRINTIPVSELTDQHLMAEYRELPMVNASLRRSLQSKSQSGLKTIPKDYTLNTGHVKFFYNKGKFLYNRYYQLIKELNKRSYNINPEDRVVDWSVFHQNNLFIDWIPDSKSHTINTERLILRIESKPHWYKYYSKPIADNFIANLQSKYRG